MSSGVLLILFLSFLTYSTQCFRKSSEGLFAQHQHKTSYKVPSYGIQSSMELIPHGHESCQCGSLSEESPDSIISRPWLAIIRVKKKKTRSICSASLLNTRFLISSATCICKLIKKTFNKVYKRIKTSTRHSVFKPAHGTVYAIFPFERNAPYHIHEEGDKKNIVSTLFVYGSYQPKSGRHDIALIRLDEEIQLFSNRFLQPICLPPVEKSSFTDIDCQIRSTSRHHEKKKHLKCSPQILNGSHSIITSWKSSRSLRGELPCMTNSFGPIRYQPCTIPQLAPICNVFESPYNLPTSDVCRFLLNKINPDDNLDSQKMFVNFRFGGGNTTTCINPNFSRSTVQLFDIHWRHNDPTDRGWCYTCQNQNETCFSWGYCSRGCIYSDTGPGPYLFDKPVVTFISSKDIHICGKSNSHFCSVGVAFHGSSINYYNVKKNRIIINPNEEDPISKVPFEMYRMKQGKNLDMAMIHDLNEIKKYGRLDMELLCDEHSGGSIWKKMSFGNYSTREFAVLTGIVSRPGKSCKNISHSYYNEPGISISTRIQPYLPWIHSLIAEGNCGERSVTEARNGSKLLSFEMPLLETEAREFMVIQELKNEIWTSKLNSPRSFEFSRLFHRLNPKIKRFEAISIIRKAIFLEFREGEKNSAVLLVALISNKRMKPSKLKEILEVTLDETEESFHVELMPIAIRYGTGTNHLQMSWTWDDQDNEMIITLKQGMKSPYGWAGVGISSEKGHLIKAPISALHMYLAFVSKLSKKENFIIINKSGSIDFTSEEVNVLSSKVQKMKDHKGWELVFKFKTHGIRELGIGKSHKFCFLIQVGDTIERNFRLATEHCFIRITTHPLLPIHLFN
ncbi:uncharacterized protein [Lepeophtheirus salmonis]|uniref:uncharacterized protein isoform X1 n=1 Tax=Lepeophtheirus salmonis TaxID=72036 RepID=UPI001AE1BE47|nr:uncharacterized protein LOC121124716 [Lepeophtheirus salmonis]